LTLDIRLYYAARDAKRMRAGVRRWCPDAFELRRCARAAVMCSRSRPCRRGPRFGCSAAHFGAEPDWLGEHV